jgi:hypothetical protein
MLEQEAYPIGACPLLGTAPPGDLVPGGPLNAAQSLADASLPAGVQPSKVTPQWGLGRSLPPVQRRDRS